MAQTYPVAGIQTGIDPNKNDPSRKVPLRRDVDEWWASQDPVDVNQQSLFIYALDFFQKMDPNDKLSYFQVSGIHGQPLKTWDEPTKPGLGYCVHGTPLFGIWHRPYVTLYEQRLYEIMINTIIPQQFGRDQQDEIRRAADAWRLPYWDWAMQKPDWHDPANAQKFGPNVPKIITQPTVQVRTKTGSATVPNPMWKFNLGQPMGNYGITALRDLRSSRLIAHFEDCKVTSRQPSVNQRNASNYASVFVDGEEQNYDAITGNLRGSDDNDTNTLPETVYRLMVDDYLPTYNSFVSTTFIKRPGFQQYLSLEGIHGNIHISTGGLGHMSQVPVAAFDPIFWMHHNNVERLACIWQDLHPGTARGNWIDSSEQGSRVRISAQDPLTPFHNDTNGTHINSDMVRDWRPLGYTYPELQKWLEKYKVNGQFSSDAYVKDIKAQMDRLYSTTARTVLALPKHEAAAEVHLATSTDTSKHAIVSHRLRVAPKPVAAPQAQDAAAQASKAMPNAPATGAQVPLAAPQTPTAAPHFAEAATDGKPPAPQPAAHEKWEENDYVVNVLYEKFALGGSPFVIRIFLGDVPQGENQCFNFRDTPTQVGQVYNFSAPSDQIGRDSSGCSNCQRQELEQTKMTGQVIITNPLVEHIVKQVSNRGAQLQSLERGDVVGYLKKNLHWRITNLNDEVIPKEDMASLKVSVAMGRATHFAEHALLSQYRDYEVLYEVTEGRLAGAGRGDEI